MNARRPSFVVVLLCCTVLLPYLCGALRCLHAMTKEGGFVVLPFREKDCRLDLSEYCRKTLCSSEDKELNTWGCGKDNDNQLCERLARRWSQENYSTPSGVWHCQCTHGEKYLNMAFTLPPTPAPPTTVTTTTKKTTKAPKPTTSTPKTSKGHPLVAEMPLALGLPMLLGILPFFHDIFAMLYGDHIN